MLIAKNLISKKDYDIAKQKGIKKFLYNEIDFIPPVSTDEQFVNCTKYRVESTWYTWKENNRIIEDFKLKCPELFVLNGYDLTLSIKKAMYWSNFKTGFLWYALNEEFQDQVNPIIDSMHSVNPLAVKLRYFRTRFKGGLKQKDFSQETRQFESKVIHVKNNFQLGLYQNILNEIYEHKDFEVFVSPTVDKQMLNLFTYKRFRILSSVNENFRFPKISFKGFNESDWFVLNCILLHWTEINESLNIAINLLTANPKVLLLNEAENGIYGALISEVMNKKGVKVFNTMNGIKSGESQDAYINFDKWFIWDQQMKNLLIQKCNLSEDKLIVSGHLIEDVIRNYNYQNSLKLDLNKLKDKKVISLFSVRGKRFVKLETLNYLYDLIKNDSSYFLMIRPHPSEKPEDYVLPELPIDNYYFVEYSAGNLNDTLHDQLFLSDLSIVFGSTVALDSKWMNVPCITYERREESLVYCVDNNWIYHVKSIDELQNKMDALLTNKKDNTINSNKSVSGFIINELNKAFNEVL